jgi:hypothetical protein
MRLRFTWGARQWAIGGAGRSRTPETERLLRDLLSDPARRGLALRLLGGDLPLHARDDAAERLLRARLRSGAIDLRGERPAIAPPTYEEEDAPPEDLEEAGVAVHWVEVVLVDMEDNPVPGERYRIKTPDGRTREGRLDREGKVRIDGIPSGGACEVTFPDLDEEAWQSA